MQVQGALGRRRKRPPSDEASPQRFFPDPRSNTEMNHNSELQETGTASTAASSLPTILLVDDDREVRSALRAALAPRFQILEAENGRYALGVLSEHIPDLIISDVSMPDMDGVVLLEAVKAIRSDVIVIIVSAYSTIDAAVDAIKLGAFDFISKPFELEALKEIVDRAFEQRKPSRLSRLFKKP